MEENTLKHYIEKLEISNLEKKYKILIKDCLIEYKKLLEYKELAGKLLKVFNEEEY